MSADSPRAFLLSATLHGAVVAAALLFTYAVSDPAKNAAKVFELVAGEGDNFGADVAPALGTPGGVKFQPTTPPTPAPTPKVEPVVQEVAPAPPPVEKALTPAPPVTKPPDFSKQITKSVIRAESKAKQQIAKERKAEEALAKNTKEEFDRQQANAKKVKVAAATPPKVQHVDGEGIAKGVLGGSTANTKGGAGGKALVKSDGSKRDEYFAILKKKIAEAVKSDLPPGLSDTLEVGIEVRIAADGTLSGARVTKSSGNDEFDRVVLAAFKKVRMNEPHPDRKSETLAMTFRTKDIGEL
jgi:colicin import membrane protein